MKNLAPNIFRQRLLIEGFYTNDVNEAVLEKYLLNVAEHLGLRTYGKPIIFSPAFGIGRDENAGYDAFIPLIDSGISAYVWSNAQFFSIVLYLCFIPAKVLMKKQQLNLRKSTLQYSGR